MKNAIVFINSDHYYCQEKQKELTQKWLRLNGIKPKSFIVERSFALPKKITEIIKNIKADYFVCADICLLGSNPGAIIKNFLRIESSGILVIAVNCTFLKSVGCTHRPIINDVFCCIEEFERFKQSSDTTQRMKKLANSGNKIGAPTKQTPSKIAQCLSLRKQGHTIRDIAPLVGLSIGTVKKILKMESN